MPPRKPSCSRRLLSRAPPSLPTAHSMLTAASRVAVADVAAVAVGAAMTKLPPMARTSILCRRKRLMMRIVMMSRDILTLRRRPSAVNRFVKHALPSPPNRRPPGRQTTPAVPLALRRPYLKCAKPNRRPRKRLPMPQRLLQRTANQRRAVHRQLRWRSIRPQLPRLSACRHCRRSPIRQSLRLMT